MVRYFVPHAECLVRVFRYRVPKIGLLPVLFYALAEFVHLGKAELRALISPVGSLTKPVKGLTIILRHHIAAFVKATKCTLRFHIAVLRSFLKPLERFRIVLYNASALL